MLLKKALKQLPSSYSEDWVALRRVHEVKTHISFRNDNLEEITESTRSGVMASVVSNGTLAYAATSSLTSSGIMEAIARAKSLAQAQTPYRVSSVASSDFQKIQAKHSPLKIRSANWEETAKGLGSAIKASKVHKSIGNAMADMTFTKTFCEILTSHGTSLEQTHVQTHGDLKVLAKNQNDSQSRSLGRPSIQGGPHELMKFFSESEASRIGHQAIELLEAANCPEGPMDLLLAPDQLYLQIHESIGHPLELDRILGDERNYAGQSFVGLKDFGTLKYGPEILNVTFDPHVEGELASYYFDDVGQKAQKEFLIEKGILVRPLGGMESQKRSELSGVANMRSESWNRAPIDRMANINIVPGNSSFEQMVAQTEKGIYMETNNSWSIDDYRNKFQFGCEYGQLIENGKITKTVKNPNYRGITLPFWRGLKAVGNQDTNRVWGSPYCGKGEPNQIITVGHATPACLFSNIEVFGGAK